MQSQPVPEATTWRVEDGWQQGRGAWGGLTISRMAQAVADQENSERKLRTLAAQILEPVTVGDYDIEVHCDREGSAMSNWSVRIFHAKPGDPVLVAQAQVITGTARATDVRPELNTWGTAIMPEVASYEQAPIVPVGPPFAPTFTERLEFRPISPLPTAGETATSLGWIRMPSRTWPGSQWTAPELMGIIDAWWPASYSLMESMRPMATVAFSVHLLIDPLSIPPIDGERAPLLHEASVSSAFGGYTSELRRLWTTDGRLVAENLQSIVVIK